jgi:multiple sugar transport system substrate-binding protein
MLKNRILFVLGILVMAALVLMACAPAAPGEQPAAGEEAAAGEGAAPEGQRELVWMVRTEPNENNWEQNVLAPAWEAENPDIKLNIQIIVQDDIAVKREAMIAAGEPLHVWSTNWGGDGFASDRARGLLTDLTPLIERDELDMSVFIPEVLAIYQSEGKTYGLPFLTTGSYIFYNMDLFDAAGVSYPTTDWEDKTWTWDAMVDVAHQLTSNYDDPTSAQYGLVFDRLNIEIPPMVFGQFPWPEDAYATGFADSVTLATPETINSFQKLHDLIYVEKVQPDAAASQALTQLGGVFQSTRVAMYMTGGWGWWQLAPVNREAEGGFCWGVAPIPWGTEDAETRAVIYTDPWVITAGLEGQELEDAWTLLKFLVREDNARTFMQASNVPPTQTVLQEEWFNQFDCMEPEQVKQVYQGAFPHGLESSNHLIVRWDELNQIWNNSLSAWIQDANADTAQVLTELEAQLTEALVRIQEEEGGQ